MITKDGLFEHPAGVVSCCATRADGRTPRVQHCFTVAC
jgi:hypothetical protein